MQTDYVWNRLARVFDPRLAIVAAWRGCTVAAERGIPNTQRSCEGASGDASGPSSGRGTDRGAKRPDRQLIGPGNCTVTAMEVKAWDNAAIGILSGLSIHALRPKLMGCVRVGLEFCCPGSKLRFHDPDFDVKRAYALFQTMATGLLAQAPIWLLHAGTYDIFFVAIMLAGDRLKVKAFVVKEHDPDSPRTFEVLDDLLARLARHESQCDVQLGDLNLPCDLGWRSISVPSECGAQLQPCRALSAPLQCRVPLWSIFAILHSHFRVDVQAPGDW